MTKEELEKEAEEKYCKGCKWRIEQCLWAWRKTNGLKEPNEKICSCKEVPAYLASAEPREKQIQIDAEQIRALQKQNGELTDKVKELEKENAELKKACDETQELLDKQIEATYKLDKENAELKEVIDNDVDKKIYVQLAKKANLADVQKEQLAKAKELLERLLITSCNSDVLNLLPNCSEVLRVRVEAEQFLSEVEK